MTHTLGAMREFPAVGRNDRASGVDLIDSLTLPRHLHGERGVPVYRIRQHCSLPSQRKKCLKFFAQVNQRSISRPLPVMGVMGWTAPSLIPRVAHERSKERRP